VPSFSGIHANTTQSISRKGGIFMPATRCEICGKEAQYGHQVSHAHNVSTKKRYPNIQRVRAIINRAPRIIHVCTRCLRSGKVQKAA
jgi:large subunit ribosomal protein L28